jgi:hypothetical protein
MRVEVLGDNIVPLIAELEFEHSAATSGIADHVEKLEILWANGPKETVVLLAVDRFYTIIQGKGIR